MELDEVESRCYGSDSVDDLNRAFQQILLVSPQLSPGELSQRALNESVGFIASTLQRCRDLYGHTPSSSREARTQQFLERTQNLYFQTLQVQTWASDASIEWVLAPRNHLNPRYSRQSNDSGVASLAESDINLNIPWKSVPGRSNLGKAPSSSFKPVALSMAQEDGLDITNFGMYLVIGLESRKFSPNQAGPSVETPIPTTSFISSLTTPCVCRGICSWCHTAEYKPSETCGSQCHQNYSLSPRVSAIAVGEYPCKEHCGDEGPTAWDSFRGLCGVSKEYCYKQAYNPNLSDVIPETPSTQTSPPDSHFASPKDDDDLTEGDTETQYDHLVENITNLVLKSKYVGQLGDDLGALINFTHAYLENIRSHDDDLDITRKLPVLHNSPCTDGGDHGSKTGGQEASGVVDANGKRKQGAGHGRHRKRDDENDQRQNQDGPDDFDDPEDWSGDRKRARIDDCQRFPCPYRRRHPTRFNVREYHQCALNTFASMALLKYVVWTSNYFIPDFTVLTDALLQTSHQAIPRARQPRAPLRKMPSLFSNG